MATDEKKPKPPKKSKYDDSISDEEFTAQMLERAKERREHFGRIR